MTERRPRKGRWFVLGVLAVVAAAVGAWLVAEWRAERRARASADLAEAARQNNLGVAKFENSDDAGAADAFAAVVRLQPDQAVGVRNLVAARLSRLTGGNSGPTKVSGGRHDRKLAGLANAAVEGLRRVEPDAVETEVLAARVAAACGDARAARDSLARAAEIAPRTGWVLYERYRLDEDATQPGPQREAEAALVAACAAEPDNLFLAIERLKMLARREDAVIREAAAAAERLLATDREEIGRRKSEALNALQKTAEAESWPEAKKWASVSKNLLTSVETFRHGQRRVNRTPLDFVLCDFPAEVYETAGLSRTPAPAPVPVTFVPGLGGTGAIEGEAIADVAAVDFDLDDRLDAVVLDGPRVTAYRVGAAGPTPIAAAEVGEGFSTLVLADLAFDLDREPTPDSDRRHCDRVDPDLVVAGRAGVRVFENRFEGEMRVLTPVPAGDGLAAVTGVIAVAAVDIDQDGVLDLVVSAEAGLSVWANDGWLRFEDRTSHVVPPPDGFRPEVILPVDLDRDADVDLLLAGGDGPPGYLENLGHGDLRWASCGTDDAARAVEVVDANGDGSWDLLASDGRGLALLKTRSPGPGEWAVESFEPLTAGAFDRLRQLDYDNDGLPDLLASEGGRPVLLRNSGTGFERMSLLDGFGPGLVAADEGDFDEDGDLDLLLAKADGARLYENRGGNANGWIDVGMYLTAREPRQFRTRQVNPLGLGGRVELKTGPVSQTGVARKPTTHFGLGAAGKPDVLRVHWTDGQSETVLEPTPRRLFCICGDCQH